MLFDVEINSHAGAPCSSSMVGDGNLANHIFINIKSRKRFSKWAKRKDDVDLQIVMEYFGYNIDKAKSALSILSPDDVNKIKEKMNKGG